MLIDHTTPRREFLKRTFGSAMVISLGSNAPRFLSQAAAAAKQQGGENVLVVVQLSGGNDGLNTVVPYDDDDYRKQRPSLQIPANQVHKINDRLGFHPSLRGMSNLLEANQLSVIPGVGYPNPNRSHFESMDIWHTCRRDRSLRNEGWLGRFMAQAKRTSLDAPATHLGDEQLPLALVSRNIQVPSIASIDRFRLNSGNDDRFREKITQLADNERSSDELMSFLQDNTVAAFAASERVEQAKRKQSSQDSYPESDLARKLQTAAELIDAGLETRIYYVTLDGFDTHAQQADAHAGLLQQLGEALEAFMTDITRSGHAQRVTVMSFSEFGRRVQENASGGTDHGAAGPMFLVGGRVKSGVIGDHPSLTDLQAGDLKHNVDFRQVYAALLHEWLGCPSKQVLGGDFKPIKVFA